MVGFRFRAAFQDVLTDSRANAAASDFIRKKIKEVVKDPEVAQKLVPTDHGFATKRPPIDTNYFETFNRDNVSLVDLKSEPIVEVTGKGVRTSRQEYELDVMVFATGFDALTGTLLNLNITGSKGVALKEAWAEGPQYVSGSARHLSFPICS